MITKDELSQQNVWRPVRRIYILILGLKGLEELGHLTWKFTVNMHSILVDKKFFIIFDNRERTLSNINYKR